MATTPKRDQTDSGEEISDEEDGKKSSETRAQEDLSVSLLDRLRANDPTMTSLDYYQLNQLKGDALIAICDGLGANITLKKLHLSSTAPIDGEKIINSIGDSLLINSTLTYLNLSHYKIGKEAGIRIGHALALNNTLLTLSLYRLSLIHI